MTTTRHQEQEQKAAAAAADSPRPKKARVAAADEAATKNEGGAAPPSPPKPTTHAAAPKQEAAAAKPAHPAKPVPQPPAPTPTAARACAARKLVSSNIVEEGTIAFLIRPRVHLPTLSSVGDAQRLYIALLPTDPRARSRLLIVGRKTLPTDAAGTHGAPSSRAWGFVDAVSDAKSVPALFGGVDAIRADEAAGQGRPRVLAEGHYVLCAHGGRDAVLAYDVDELAVEGDADAPAAAAFGVHPGLGLSGKSRATLADFGDAAAAFGGGDRGGGPPGGYAWAPATGAGGGRLLEVGHAEVLLVGASLASSSLTGDAVARLRDAHHTAVGGEAEDEAWVRDVLGDKDRVLEVGEAVTGGFEE